MAISPGDEGGQSVVEYALILLLIVALVAMIAFALRTRVYRRFVERLQPVMPSSSVPDRGKHSAGSGADVPRGDGDGGAAEGDDDPTPLEIFFTRNPFAKHVLVVAFALLVMYVIGSLAAQGGGPHGGKKKRR